MTKEELYKVTDILNDVLSNYLRGSEAEEVIAKLEESVEDSELIKEEPVSEDLEEAAKRYVDERMALLNPDVADMSCDRDTKMSFDVFDGSEVEAAFYEGTQWQKQQMMKESIDGEIRFGTVKVQKEDIKEAVKSLCEGDKVKLIVIKK